MRGRNWNNFYYHYGVVVAAADDGGGGDDDDDDDDDDYDEGGGARRGGQYEKKKKRRRRSRGIGYMTMEHTTMIGRSRILQAGRLGTECTVVAQPTVNSNGVLPYLRSDRSCFKTLQFYDLGQPLWNISLRHPWGHTIKDQNRILQCITEAHDGVISIPKDVVNFNNSYLDHILRSGCEWVKSSYFDADGGPGIWISLFQFKTLSFLFDSWRWKEAKAYLFSSAANCARGRLVSMSGRWKLHSIK